MPAGRRDSARVTTRTGDAGDTSLFGKGRVRKTDPRIGALGDLDEAQSAIGVARALAPGSAVGKQLLELQQGLYVAMAEVATPKSEVARLGTRLNGAAVSKLEASLETLKAGTPIAGRFVVPGEEPVSAALDHARTVARRAERSVVACVDADLVSGDVLLPWLNRLSDLLFVLARSAEGAARPATDAKTVRRRAAR
ncbi:MAG TPA: cob(I)yrinic acid a,c-diamide adenosyltransferase [Candidatus Limnocylindria bacterium]|nr:cob(I)yrinic acid a,c-diamide adenosyltransferase [Candidatus Limnocylindria bacterium]